LPFELYISKREKITHTEVCFENVSSECK